MSDLRLLDPQSDLELFERAFRWRTPKKHLAGVGQMPFETFIDSQHLVFGLFDPELIAVYFYREWEPARFEAHFTSRKGVKRETLLWGGAATVGMILKYGGEEVDALILPANKPLRDFVTHLGFRRIGLIEFTCVETTQGDTISPRNQRQRFIKYVKMKEVTPLGSFRHHPKEQFHPVHAGYESRT
jgi:hypothetical protein